ncbi:hypothetical protein [Mangrovimonas cancribranchiae]|uniref:Lipoprotein n=1 Tax=Mangrovimonas cancribranchiae TaxID=3080055 RepID=A0AAU6NXP2_9FLAO
MMTKTKRINIIFILLILFSCDSNVDQNLFDSEQKEEVLNYFEASELFFEVENNLYILNIIGSKIDNAYILEENSKVIALKICQILKEKPEISFNTEIIVKLEGKYNNSYNYKLFHLAEIQEGLESVEKSINHLKNNKVLLEDFYIDLNCNDKPIIANEIDWDKIQNVNLINFEIAEFDMCDQIIESVLYRINLLPLNINIWVYYYPKDHKIIAIGLPQGS